MKELWFDIETTGTDVRRHGIIQIAMIAVVGGEVYEKSWRVRPFAEDAVDPEALQVNRTTREEIADYPQPEDIHKEVCIFLNRFVNKFDREDKFTPGGYNADKFDLPFLKAWFEKCGDKYFGSYFDYMTVDPYPILRFLRYMGAIDLSNYKLATACQAFGVPLGDDAHDALADIRATRALAVILKEQIRFRLLQ